MRDVTYKLPIDFIANPQSVNIHIYKGGSSISRSRVELDQHVLSILIDGKKDIYHSDHNNHITNSHFFLLQSGNTLMIDKPENHNFKSILIFFSNEYLSRFWTKYGVLQQDVKSSSSGLYVFEKDDYILRYQQTLTVLDPKYLNNLQFSELKLDEILSYLLFADSYKLQCFISKCLLQEKNISFTQIIDNNKYTDISVSEIAFLCNMSISTFSRKFQDVYHVSPKQYFMKCRMEKAQKLLLTGKNVSVVCDELKYQNISAFSRQFKKYFGISPTEYLFQSKSITLTDLDKPLSV